MCGNYDCRFGPFIAQQTQYAGMLIIPCGSHASVVFSVDQWKSFHGFGRFGFPVWTYRFPSQSPLGTDYVDISCCTMQLANHRNLGVFFFSGAGEAEGHAELQGKQEELLGNKGANLAEMASIGLPVPPGFTLTTEAHCVMHPGLSWEKFATTDRH